MDNQLKQIIEEQYGFLIKNILDAPRQFVAETYVIESSDNTKYFCKIVKKPLFIPHLIESLPVLKELYIQGLERINFPITTKNGKLYVKFETTLIVLFNYIDAPQNYDYDNYAYGKLLASVHNITNKITIPVPRESFVYKFVDIFETKLMQILTNTSNDNIAQSLKILLTKYADEIKHDYANFLKLSSTIKQQTHTMVITHGDPGGNTLVKSPTDLYLIDWDNILLSPPERDAWFFQDNPGFLEGYRSVFPEYEVNQELNHYFIYNRYFEDLVEYFAEIIGDHSDDHKRKNLKKLEEDCFEGWLRPAIRHFDPKK